MSFPIIDLISQFFYSVIGNSLLMALIIIGLFMVMMFAMRANLAVALAVLIPLIIGLMLNQAGSNFISIASWVLIAVFMIAAIIFVAVFNVLQR